MCKLLRNVLQHHGTVPKTRQVVAEAIQGRGSSRPKPGRPCYPIANSGNQPHVPITPHGVAGRGRLMNRPYSNRADFHVIWHVTKGEKLGAERSPPVDGFAPHCQICGRPYARRAAATPTARRAVAQLPHDDAPSFPVCDNLYARRHNRHVRSLSIRESRRHAWSVSCRHLRNPQPGIRRVGVAVFQAQAQGTTGQSADVDLLQPQQMAGGGV